MNTADKIREIEKKQHFQSDWFEESLQEMADWKDEQYRELKDAASNLYETARKIAELNVPLRLSLNKVFRLTKLEQ